MDTQGSIRSHEGHGAKVATSVLRATSTGRSIQLTPTDSTSERKRKSESHGSNKKRSKVSGKVVGTEGESKDNRNKCPGLFPVELMDSDTDSDSDDNRSTFPLGLPAFRYDQEKVADLKKMGSPVKFFLGLVSILERAGFV